MAGKANPQDPQAGRWKSRPRQTLEYRVSDGSANIHQLLAGLAAAVIHGYRDVEALERAEQLRVEGNLFQDELLMHSLEKLPASCEESAEELLRLRQYFENDGIFPSTVIDGVAAELSGYADREALRIARGDDELTRRLVQEYFHVG